MIGFTEFFIKRPAFTIVISLVMSIFGILAYHNLPVRWIPNINPPVVAIYTQYSGASASLVESQITTPIESALSGVSGIDSISSNSKQDASFITIVFKLGHNINVAVEDVRSALQRINGILPNDCSAPQIEKADPNTSPIMYLAISDKNKSSEQVSDYVKQFILPRLQTIDGVATVASYGEKASAVRIWIDPMRMAAANVTIGDISRTLQEQNIQVPSGKIRGETRNFSVVTNETLKSIDEFKNLIIRDNQNHIIRLSDIAKVGIEAANPDTIFRVNGQQAIALAIIPQSTANPLEVANSVDKEFTSLSNYLPQGMQGKIIFNQATFIKDSIHHVYESLVEAVILVLLVIFLFLASWRAALVPIVTIPICLVTTFVVMSWLKISINTITLMAFVLAIGLVVDDAIVMLENITRYVEKGLNPFQAAIKGSREIIFPIIAMTMTLVAVYAPIALTSGLLGTVFWEFAVTLASAVLISGIVALTLSPMMSARLNLSAEQNKYGKWLQNFFIHLQNYYSILLEKAFKKKALLLFVVGIVGVSGYLVYHFTPSELAPLEDMNQINVFLSAPRDASFDFTNKHTQKLEELYQAVPEIQVIGTQAGFNSPSNATQFLFLTPKTSRSRSVSDIVKSLNEKVENIPGVKVSVAPAMSPLSWYSSGNGSSVVMRIMSAADYKTLFGIMQRFLAQAEQYPGFLHVDSRLKWNGSQFEININREKAADMQIAMPDITNTISSLLAGRTFGHYEFNGNLYDIIVQMNKEYLSDPNIISKLYVRNQLNSMVPLQGLVSVTQTTNPESLPHAERLRSDLFFASLAPGYSIGEAVHFLQKVAKEVLPDNTKFSFEGEAKSYLDSHGKTGTTFLLALLLIYLILVAQFESFVDPFIILLTVPFAMVGGLFSIKLMGGSFNIYSSIAFVTLIGLIAKHGILITEFANKYYTLGMSLEESVKTAARLRLRPILMTTASMVLGALPLAFASGSGAETRQQIGFVIVGGLLVGTFFSLFIVPIMYTYLARFKKQAYSPLLQEIS